MGTKVPHCIVFYNPKVTQQVKSFRLKQNRVHSIQFFPRTWAAIKKRNLVFYSTHYHTTEKNSFFLDCCFKLVASHVQELKYGDGETGRKRERENKPSIFGTMESQAFSLFILWTRKKTLALKRFFFMNSFSLSQSHTHALFRSDDWFEREKVPSQKKTIACAAADCRKKYM